MDASRVPEGHSGGTQGQLAAMARAPVENMAIWGGSTADGAAQPSTQKQGGGFLHRRSVLTASLERPAGEEDFWCGGGEERSSVPLLLPEGDAPQGMHPTPLGEGGSPLFRNQSCHLLVKFLFLNRALPCCLGHCFPGCGAESRGAFAVQESSAGNAGGGKGSPDNRGGDGEGKPFFLLAAPF